MSFRPPAVRHWIHARPRSGEAVDYEDAADLGADTWPICAAVADGATESAYADTWAQILVQGIVEAKATTADAVTDLLPRMQARWAAAVSSSEGDAPWYVNEKIAEGAFAAALGLSLQVDGRWQAVAVGDCCLFHVGEGRPDRSWPIEAPEAFTDRPALLPSREGATVPPLEAVTGTWRSGDHFVLATDAAAAWLLRTDPLKACAPSEGQVEENLHGARTKGTLRNDDVTLLVIEMRAPPPDVERFTPGAAETN